MNYNNEMCDEWTLEDDMHLLNAISHCGYGNWIEVAARCKSKPVLCERRYLEKFVINPDNEELKNISKTFEILRKNRSLCSHCDLSVDGNDYHYHSLAELLEMECYLKSLNKDRLKSFSKVKREFQESSKSVGENKLSSHKRRRYFLSNELYDNYNPLRSEFDVEFDNNAEEILEMLYETSDSSSFNNDEDDSLFKELQCALADSYNFRLSERIRRKEIIRNHGLIDRRKTYNMFQRLDVPFGKSLLTALFSFMKLISGPKFDFLVESLYYQNELRTKLNTLIAYRELGIRFLNGINTYEKLNKRRLKYRREIGYEPVPLLIENLECRNSRRPSAPLALHNLPGFHLLNEDEKQLCSTVRIVPETYYNFKQLLRSECRKNDGLRLVQARQLMKIDVNKTRKMYDYLISTGDIWQPKND